MATEQESAYETQRKLGLEYDWTEDDGRIVLSRWSGTQESRWRVEQIQIHKDGKVTLFMP